MWGKVQQINRLLVDRRRAESVTSSNYYCRVSAVRLPIPGCVTMPFVRGDTTTIREAATDYIPWLIDYGSSSLVFVFLPTLLAHRTALTIKTYIPTYHGLNYTVKKHKMRFPSVSMFNMWAHDTVRFRAFQCLSERYSEFHTVLFYTISDIPDQTWPHPDHPDMWVHPCERICSNVVGTVWTALPFIMVNMSTDAKESLTLREPKISRLSQGQL